MIIDIESGGGGKCPRCGEYGRRCTVDDDGDDLIAEYECRACGTVFHEVYVYDYTEFEKEE